MGTQLIPLLAFFLLLTTPLVAARPLEMTLQPAMAEVHSGTLVSFGVTVKNPGPGDEYVVLSVAGDRPWWWQPSVLAFTVPAGGEQTMAQTFYPVGAEQGDYPFTMQARSFDDPAVSVSAPFLIRILPPLFLTAIDAEKKDHAIDLTLGLSSADERAATLQLTVTDSRGAIISNVSSTETVSAGAGEIKKSIPFPFSPPGVYTVEASLGSDALRAQVIMEEVVRFEKTVVSVPSLLYDDVAVAVVNTGNVPATFTLPQTVPAGAPVTGELVAPASVATSAGESTRTYALALVPGQSGEIRYRVERWPVFAQLGAVSALIAVAGILVAGKYTRPRISKHYRRGRKATSVIVGVKNAFRDSRNVVVRDWVSPLATVVMDEFEAVKPTVRQSDAGTELVWSLGTMRPLDERMVSYKIIPLVQGNLRLGRASIHYKDHRGEARKIYSKTVAVE